MGAATEAISRSSPSAEGLLGYAMLALCLFLLAVAVRSVIVVFRPPRLHAWPGRLESYAAVTPILGVLYALLAGWWLLLAVNLVTVGLVLVMILTYTAHTFTQAMSRPYDQ